MGFMRSTDFISNKTEISYRQKGIWKKFRSNSLTFTQENRWDFDGAPTDNYVAANWSTTFLNRLQFNVKETYIWNKIDNRMLRGGPDMRLNPYFMTSVSFSTDRGKRVMAQVRYDGDHSIGGYSYSNAIRPSLTFRLGNHVYLIGEFRYAENRNDLQYVARAIDTQNLSAPKYIMGRIDQKTYELTLKVQTNLTPDISIQFYGSPFTSTGSFDAFKLATDTKSRNYENRYHAFTPAEISYLGDTYSVGRGGENYSFRNPDFSFNEFRSNLVARWEYKPGSTLYFVWEHVMSNRDQYYVSGWRENLDRMMGLPATNIFMVKLNYWFRL